jgi:hypothetical protein
MKILGTLGTRPNSFKGYISIYKKINILDKKNELAKIEAL